MSPKASEQHAEREEILPAVANVTSALPMLMRAEIDSQIATARQYPRDVKSASDDIMGLATLDEQTAAEMMYALPRGNKPIRGPSVRLAEIIAQCWGNNRVTAQVVEIDRNNKIVTTEGTFHDLQTNSAIKAVVNRRISDKKGRLYSDDMIVTTAMPRARSPDAMRPWSACRRPFGDAPMKPPSGVLPVTSRPLRPGVRPR